MDRYDFIVLGAGQAGLAAGYYLQQAGRRFLLLDAHARVGDSWRLRWEGLRLFSPQRYNALPGLAPLGEPWHRPDRLEMADYLETYAKRFALPVRSHCTCLQADYSNSGWRLETTQGTFSTHRLIVATGAYRTAYVPGELAAQFPARIKQYHSAEVRSVPAIVDAASSVLIVGAGASGQQLARLAVATRAEVLLAGPEVGNLPRTFLGKDIYWWLYRSGLMTMLTDRFPGKYLRSEAGEVTVGEAPLPEVRRFSTEVTGFVNEQLTFRCRKTVPKPVPWPAFGRRGVVIWCTGYRNEYPFLPERALDENGQPYHVRGLHPKLPGLGLLGLPHLRRTNSSLVGGVGEDARWVVNKLLK
ncbi:MAG: NAD(P)-binding domain-containing protein [Bacteroidota bacterium]